MIPVLTLIATQRMMTIIPLSQLKPGQSAIIDHLDSTGDVGLKLVELGFCAGETVQYLRQAPLHGPVEVEIMAYRLCIRQSEAEKIFVRVS